MKVVVAIDSFKGSLSSLEGGQAVKRGIKRAWPEARVVVRALADGGEGTVEALIGEGRGERQSLRVTGPLGEPVEAAYGILRERKTAVMEAAEAAGLTQVPPLRRNPLETTSFGMGQLIRDAVEKGSRDFIIGMGGSAVNDCGIGMLSALGWRFLDKEGKEIPLNGGGLEKIARIEEKDVLPQLKECRFRIACDVTNPLWGERGASHVFGPQKGATPEMVVRLDAGCRHFSEVVRKQFGRDEAQTPGVGAAGGMGYAFVAFLNGSLQSGIGMVLEEIALEKDLIDADYVVTGEGRLDFQTAMGKAPIGVTELAKKHGVKVIGVAGSVTEDAGECNEKGMDAFFPILRGVITLEEAMEKERAEKNMEQTAEQIFRLIRAVEKG